MDSPNQKQTKFLKLRYLDPSQAQPEVKINEAWDILDEAIENGLPINTGGSDAGGGSITVEDRTDSPHVAIDNVTVLRFEGFRVQAESGGVAKITALDASDTGGGSLTVEDRADSPAIEITDVSVLRFVGAKVESESGGVAQITMPAPPPVGAQWVSVPAGAALSLPTNPVLAIASAEGHIKEVRIYTQGGSGSCVIDIWRAAAGTFPTSGNDVTGGSPPTISAGTAYANTTLSGWLRNVAKGDAFLFTLASVSGSFTGIWISILLG